VAKPKEEPFVFWQVDDVPGLSLIVDDDTYNEKAFKKLHKLLVQYSKNSIRNIYTK